MIAASSGDGGGSVDTPAHATPTFARTAAGLIARRRERVDLASLVSCDLGDDVRGGAEPKNPDSLAGPCHAIRTVTYEAGTQERRGV